MNFFARISSSIWIIALLGAGGFLLWIDAANIRRIEYISGLADPVVKVEAGSPTGYTAGLRRLIVPEHNNESYQWIAQTQQMLARNEGRVRHVDYDNAPFGREVRTPSPYRWWLGLIAWCDHLVSGQPLGLTAERAALFADPALQLLLMVGTVIFTARQFGAVSAALLALAWAATFPLAGIFLPGQPNDGSLALACVLWSVLPLLAGIRASRQTGSSPDDLACAAKRARRWFFVAGVAGGIGLWVSTASMLPILGGIAVGGLLAAWLTRRAGTSGTATTEVAPWRIWALGGATTTLLAYLIEYFPAHMEGLRFETIHPLFGVAWLGAGELLEQASAWGQRKQSPGKIRTALRIAPAILAVASVPVVLALTSGSQLMADDPFAGRLTNLSDGIAATDLRTWLFRDRLNAMAVATFLPLLLLVPAFWLLVRRATGAAQREAIALAIGPVLVALGFACFQLGWWSLLDGLLLTLLVAATMAVEAKAGIGRWLWFGSVGLLLIPGAMLLLEQVRPEKREAVTEGDVVALIERDLAYWLANQASPGGAIVLAPPRLTTSLYFHGGLAGLGTPYWENKDGFSAAVRIAGATSPDEAQAVAQNRNLTYIIIPSWDPFMDEYARLGSGQPEKSLVSSLHRWLPPRWLRPVPYQLPRIPGFEGLSVTIFQVTEVQEQATALSRLAEYFIEMEQADQAAAAGQALERLFPSDLGALVSRTLVEQARGNAAGFAKAVNELPAYLSRGDDSSLPWDRRVSLAIALAEGKRFELAKEQTKQCLAEIDEARVRSLSTVSLYRLQVLSKAFGLEITDPSLRTLCRRLLPAEMRGNL